jgi:3-dehydroquinate synthase
MAASARRRTVISVGGGAVMNPENRSMLEANGVIVLLTCERDRLIERLEGSARRGERPMLGDDLGERIDALTASRAGVYASIPLKVDTTHLAPEEVAARVIKLWRELGVFPKVPVRSRRGKTHPRPLPKGGENNSKGSWGNTPQTPRQGRPPAPPFSWVEKGRWEHPQASGQGSSPAPTLPGEGSMMRDTRFDTIRVQSPEGGYDIVLGHGTFDSLGRLVGELGLGRKVVVASDTNVAPLYAERVLAVLTRGGFEAALAVMPAGEGHKSWDSVEMFVEAFLDAGLDRGGWVAALGGGVVGDTAGFAASVFMRGVDFVQIPTTLLAMADSSIGGKVGVDHARGKNLLGTFKQPRLVVADLDVLASLPAEQVACGMAEVIKAGMIGDEVLFGGIDEGRAGYVMRHTSYVMRDDPSRMTYDLRSTIYDSLRRAIEVKRGIVERDPHEAGERALLNLGHTFGHAFEKCTGYNRPHGYAVAQGMTVACKLAGALGICDDGLAERVERVLGAWGLPVRWGAPDLEYKGAVERVWEAMMLDKKRANGRLRLVLPEAIGRVRLVDDAPEAAIKSVLMETK